MNKNIVIEIIYKRKMRYFDGNYCSWWIPETKRCVGNVSLIEVLKELKHEMKDECYVVDYVKVNDECYEAKEEVIYTFDLYTGSTNCINIDGVIISQDGFIKDIKSFGLVKLLNTDTQEFISSENVARDFSNFTTSPYCINVLKAFNSNLVIVDFDTKKVYCRFDGEKTYLSCDEPQPLNSKYSLEEASQIIKEKYGNFKFFSIAGFIDNGRGIQPLDLKDKMETNCLQSNVVFETNNIQELITFLTDNINQTDFISKFVTDNNNEWLYCAYFEVFCFSSDGTKTVAYIYDNKLFLPDEWEEVF